MLGKLMGRNEAEDREDLDEEPEVSAIDAAAELELLRRDVAAAEAKLRAAQADIRKTESGFRGGAALDRDVYSSLQRVEAAAESALDSARARVERHRASLEEFPEEAAARISELEDRARELVQNHPRAIEHARAVRTAYLEAIEDVFRAPAMAAIAVAELRAIAALFDLDGPGDLPSIEISADVREELLRPPIGERARNIGTEAHAQQLVTATSILQDQVRVGQASSIAERKRALGSIRRNLTASSRRLVDALAERVDALSASRGT